MFVKRLSVKSFRNFEDLTLDFPNRLIYIKGENASGKTNLIEALYYLSLTRSFKKAEDKDLIKEGAEYASLGLIFASEKQGEHTLKIDLLKQGKLVYFDDEKQKSVTKIVGKLPTIVYEPSLTMLFKQDPASRRKLIDETLSNLSQNYLYSLSRYKKLIKERNVALYQNYDEDVLTVLTSELTASCYEIYVEREKFIKRLNKELGKIYRDLFETEEDVEIEYLTNVPRIFEKEKFIFELKNHFDRIKTEERIKKVTLLGVHRDDLIAKINKKNIGVFASQGQNRLFTLSLKLTIGKIYEEEFKEKPVYLLDDVLSDLDQRRIERLLKYLSNEGQVFITLANQEEDNENQTIYDVYNQTVKRRM